ncbi:MAG TPA: TIGR04211 family SH3 domain-containing protein [Chromatiaceae bacterium]|jgi:SH3 domain protein|nr:TIGR04211 family SH3 domain-containing protein [Chromatiaceae bacterium]HIN83209.1 TIGR04211 family SH3 domain-containing protein [Chromatiales bacterium]
MALRHYITALLLLLSCNAMAESVRYVTDELRLSLYKEASAKSEVLRKIGSGAKVIQLGKDGYYAKVRLENGTIGWVKATFLTREQPARSKLIHAEANLAEAVESVARFRAERDSAKQRLESIGAGQAELQSQLNNVITARDILDAENLALNSRLAQTGGQVPSSWLWISAFITLVLGLVGGLYFADYRMRRRHGGFRVY